MICKCEHWQVCDECRQGRFPKTEDKDMTKELLQQLQKFSQEVAELDLNHSNSQQYDDMLGVKTEQFFDDHLKALAQQEVGINGLTHDETSQTASVMGLTKKAQQEQPASVDAYVGAREDAAIWKKRALEAEELNRKFIAELNGPTYLGEPAQPAQKPDLWKTQFLTDVMTSAGLLRYGRTDKKLAQRIADGSARWRTELYTHPTPTQPALSDADIEKVITKGVKSGSISWTGFKEDSEGKYTVPVLSGQHYQVARAIEAHLKGQK